jgi:glycosyltransferase involved in cell wall biosynthesis
MPAPDVSILLPVYNSQHFVKKAIDSLLKQTFTDFELLAINDGSTDGSEKVIQSFKDNRIIYLKNKTSKGLIFTLNKGVKFANGKYIARMDGDDISLPDRLQKQVNWLERFPATDLVACQVRFIDENDNVSGHWKEDLETVTYREIQRKMVWENCIAHSSVMIRSGIVKEYLFSEKQQYTEDYDLWLRLLADGIRIEKIPEELLLYRVHPLNGTRSINSKPFLKAFNCKRKFLSRRLLDGEWGLFESKVAYTTLYDATMALYKEIKGIGKI